MTRGISWKLLEPSLLKPGGLLLIASERGVLWIDLWSGRRPLEQARARAAELAGRFDVSISQANGSRKASRISDEAARELEEYFDGERSAFDFPLDLSAQGTEFELRVWRALRLIPHGTVVSYGQVAAAVGCANASRAVGGAVGRNPIPIVIPCHRVIGSGGKLTGFGSGLRLKEALLEHEGMKISRARTLAASRVLS